MQALKAALMWDSLESLNKLIKLIDRNFALHTELMPIFYHHLDPKKIPHPTHPPSNMFYTLKMASGIGRHCSLCGCMRDPIGQNYEKDFVLQKNETCEMKTENWMK